MSSPFPCSPVIREWSWKKTQIEKKKKKKIWGTVCRKVWFMWYRMLSFSFIGHTLSDLFGKTNRRKQIYQYLSIHPSIHPFMHLSIYLSIDPSIHPSIHLSIHPSIYLCKRIRLFIDRTVCVSKIICSEEKKYLMR